MRATVTSYFALCGIWVVLFLGYVLLSFSRPGRGLESGAVIAGSVAALTVAWLRGFKITISNRLFEYRDGLYRNSKIPVADITKVQSKWVEWARFPRGITVPRIVVSTKDRRTILINAKPFARRDIQKVLELLGEQK